MYLRVLPERAIQSITSRVCWMLIGGSIRMASVRPKISVEVIGDEIIGSPEGSFAPPDLAMPSVTRISYPSLVGLEMVGADCATPSWLATEITSASVESLNRFHIFTVPFFA